MKDGSKKKHYNSIAARVSQRAVLILLSALAVLLAASYFGVSTIIRRKTEKTSEQLVSMYSDIIKGEYETAGMPILPEYPDLALTYGEFMCEWFDIDYAFVLVPYPERGVFQYVCAAYKDPEMEEKYPDHFVGLVKENNYTTEELNLWMGKKQFSHIVTKSLFGHELITETIIEDSYGNRVSVGVDVDNIEIYREINRYFLIIGLALAAVIAAVGISMYFVIRGQVSVPAKKLSKAMTSFAAGGKSEKISLAGTESDEFAMIADAFGTMSDNIDSYLRNIESLTRESERRETELDVAANIQKGFLPTGRLIYERYELSAMMKPANEVAGDLYDYVPLDENRVLTVIADVSGKGIAASIFMAVTLTLIHQYAKMNLPPDEILEKTNSALAANNTEMLFVTAFVGIYDSRTKTLTYSNAGHNLPYVVGENVRTLSEANGVVLGLFEGEKYTSAVEQLSMGETLLLYTDGVTEATDSEKHFFGEKRLEELLSSFRTSHAPDIVGYVSHALDEFADGSEQHDDITMLSLTVKDTTELSLDVEQSEFDKIRDAILSLPLPRQKQLELCLAAEECFVNIVSYAFEGKDASKEKIGFRLAVSDRILMRFEDSGTEFDPREGVGVGDYDPDVQMGGLGRFIAFSAVDEINYEYTNGKNILSMIKYLGGDRK